MKLFVEEPHSTLMQSAAAESERVMVSMLTWAELLAALSRKQRTGQVEAKQVSRVLGEMEGEWPRYYKLGVDRELIADAGRLALRFGVRGYDSVQLATAQRAQKLLGTAMTFCCFDNQLNVAARALNLETVSP